jgi:lipopolysaccharide transport system permease protein
MTFGPWRHRALIAELARREFSGRYRGSFGGLVWSFAQPLFLLAVYTVAFGVILKAQWGFPGGTASYALMLFAGLIVFDAFSDCLAAAPGLVLARPNFVKRIVFPLDILPWVMALTAFLHALIALAVWVLGYTLLFGVPRATAAFAPAVLLCFFPVLLGVGWLLSAIGVFVRDVGQLTAMASQALLFLTPIFYGIDAAPAALRPFLMANPLTFIVEQLRRVLYSGELPAVGGLAAYLALSSLFAAGAYLVFRRLRPDFAEMV